MLVCGFTLTEVGVIASALLAVMRHSADVVSATSDAMGTRCCTRLASRATTLNANASVSRVGIE